LALPHTTLAGETAYQVNAGDRQTDLVIVMYNKEANELLKKHCLKMEAFNPQLRPLCFMDGTGGVFNGFGRSAPGFTVVSQYVYPAHKAIPVALLIHSGRNMDVYEQLVAPVLSVMGKNAPVCSADFEKAEAKAFAGVFPNMDLSACYFHFLDAITLWWKQHFNSNVDLALKERCLEEVVLPGCRKAHYARTRDLCLSAIAGMCQELSSNNTRFKGFAAFVSYFHDEWVKKAGRLEQWTTFHFYQSPREFFYLVSFKDGEKNGIPVVPNPNDTNNFEETTVKALKKRLGVANGKTFSLFDVAKNSHS
jgi:hypothetical protein